MEPNNTQPPSGEEEKKNNKAIWIIVVIIILLCLGWYFTKGSGSTALKSGTTTAGTEQNGPMSLKDLMMGKAQKCTVSYDTQNNQSQGIVYVSSGKMRGDFTSEVNGKIQTTHMINDGQYSYMWVEGENSMAFKMSANSVPPAQPSGTAQAAPQTPDMQAKQNYNCSFWTEDNSQFTPPSNIKFTDYSEMMKSLPTPPAQNGANTGAGASGSADVKAMQCAACDNLTGSQQAQCKAALACK